MTIIEAYNSFRHREERASLFDPAAFAWRGEDPWALGCTWMAAVVDGIEAAQTDEELDEAVREYSRRTISGCLPAREPQMALLHEIACKIEPNARNLPSVN